MNKITIIKECIKAYNRENTVKANVCFINPVDYHKLYWDEKFYDHKDLENYYDKVNDRIVVEGVIVKIGTRVKKENVQVGYKPELILN